MTIFTVGHSRHSIEHFLSLLRGQAILQLVDVRSQPHSQWAPHFGKAVLSQTLDAQGIEYVFMGRALGGRPAEAVFYRQDGTVDYARRAEASDFKAGIEHLVGLSQDRPTTILCAEEDPTGCHRRLLVAPALRQAGSTVVHIRGDGRLVPDKLDPTPTPRRQFDLFGGKA
jgi:uncharacterized protein (DUF488 family)